MWSENFLWLQESVDDFLSNVNSVKDHPGAIPDDLKDLNTQMFFSPLKENILEEILDNIFEL